MWKDDEIEPKRQKKTETFVPKQREQSGKAIRGQISRILNAVPPNHGRKFKAARGGLFSLGAKGSFTRSGSYNSRRAVVKGRIIKNDGATYQNKLRLHLKYIERDGAGIDGNKGELYSSEKGIIDGSDFLKRSQNDEHSFRFILSWEDGNQLDLKDKTRTLIKQMEADLGTKLDWVAVDHYNTDDPHTHIIIRGANEHEKTLIIGRDYISNGIRNRAREIATLELGHRSEIEINESILRSIEKERITEIDHQIDRIKDFNGHLDLRSLDIKHASFTTNLIRKRLQYLNEIGLSKREDENNWLVRDDFKKHLNDRGARGDIIKMMNREMGLKKEDISISDSKPGTRVFGTVLRRGFSDEMSDNEYLVVCDNQGKNHYLALNRYSEKERCNVGDKIEVFVPKQRLSNEGLALRKPFVSTKIIERKEHKNQKDFER